MTIEEIKKLQSMSNARIIKHILNLYDESFNLVINNNRWCFSCTPLEVSDVRNIFLYQIPSLVRLYNNNGDNKMKMFLCLKLKHLIFNESRKFGARKYKVLNTSAQLADRKYQIKCLTPSEEDNKIDFSVLSPFEYSVYLSLFEACKSINFVAHDHKVSRRQIEQTLYSIKRKIKKQLQ